MKFPWERIALFGFGAVFLLLSIAKVYENRVVEAGGVAVIALMCLAFANLTRFKHFKGLGFEGELWEDKQQEASELIDRIKNVVAINTREMLLTSVKSGRWGVTSTWRERWKLYNDLVRDHSDLDKKLDFSDVKRQMDSYFIFDIYMRMDGVGRAFADARSEAEGALKREFGAVAKDPDAYGKRLAQLREIKFRLDDPFAIVSNGGNLGAAVIDMIHDTMRKLKDGFGTELKMDAEDLKRLQKLAEVGANRPVQVTEELISWADARPEQ